MEYLKGTVKDGEKVLIENIYIKLTVNNSSGFSSWNGYFSLSSASNVNFQKLFFQNPGKSFDLYLEDERKGKFYIPNILTNSSTGSWIYFEGSGELKKPN